MNNAMPKDELEQILDQAVRDVTESAVGVRLRQGDRLPGDASVRFKSPLTEALVPVLPFAPIPGCCTVWPAGFSMRNRSALRIWRSSVRNI